MIRQVFLLSFMYLIALNRMNLISAQQSFAEMPKNTSVKLGEEVMLKCSIKNQKGEVIWCKEESFCTFNRKRNFTDSRLSIGGDEAKGEHHLIIKNVSIVDDTKYQCQVTASETDASIKSEWAFLTVLIKPASIEIVSNNKANNSTVRLITNQTTSLECNVENSNPPCSIAWFKDSTELKASTEISGLSTTSKKQPSKLYRTTGKITIKPLQVQDWNSKTLKCECFNEYTNSTQTSIYDTKIVSVNYSPIVKILRITHEDILAGTYIQFECNSDAQPPVTNYKWYIDDKVYGNGIDEKFIFLKIEESMNKKLLKCDAKNEVSTQTGTYLLELTYGPKFKQELPSHKIVSLNEYLSLTCDVDSYPQSSIIWSLNDTFIFAHQKLIINSVKPENYGTYKCTASLKDFQRISSTCIVIPPGPPIIEANEIQYGYFGDPGSIECLFEKEPKPQEIVWYKSNKKIDFDRDLNLKLKNDIVDRKGTKSILVFREITEDDFVNYTCKGTNSYGSRNFTIKLQPKTKELGNIFSVIIIFLFLFSTGIIIGFITYLKFSKIKMSKKKKKYKKKYSKVDRLRSRPSAMLNSMILRTYPKRKNFKLNRNLLNRFGNQNLNRGNINNYNEIGQLSYLSSYHDLIDPRNLNQFDGNGLDTFNYLSYEYGDGGGGGDANGSGNNYNNNNPYTNIETSESSFIDTENNSLYAAKYQTDV